VQVAIAQQGDEASCQLWIGKMKQGQGLFGQGPAAAVSWTGACRGLLEELAKGMSPCFEEGVAPKQ